MSDKKTKKRIRERLELKLPVRIHCRETSDFEWTEMTRLINVTPFGAGFTLKHPTERGRLLHMTIPMPRQLRVFDHLEDQYKVWAIVRYVRALPQADSALIFDIGVAFIGKRPPASYESEPWKRYDISSSAAESMSAASEIPAAALSADQRTETRHHMAVDMLLEILDEKGEVAEKEQTVSENISRQGATLFTTLSVPVGRFVRVSSERYKITVFATVRARNTGADGIPRIHIEFIDKEWEL